MSFLEIRDLTYTYPGGIRAVDGFDFDARQGEFIAVIGPNAAGKSTLALLLKGLLKAEKGFVRINGGERPREGADPRVGILFANPENQLITSIVEEHFGHTSGSTPYTRFRRRAQILPGRRFCGAGSVVSARRGWSAARCRQVADAAP